MRRLYFMLPNVEITSQIVDKLLLKRINEHHIHVVASEGTALGELPEASLLQKSDFIPAVERGLALGGGAILGTSLAGAGIGAWVSGMIGVDVPNSQIQRFEQAIDKGEILMMVDVPKTRVSEIEALVHQHFPKAELGGTEPHIPAFP